MTFPTAPGVTLCAASSVGLEATVWAMRRSLEQVRFEKAVLLSDVRPEGLEASGIEWRRIDRISSRTDYSRFMLHKLADHIKTSHVLVVQWDGFVRDGSRWNGDFLRYDYIGAVWPQFEDERKVGNGGFSLRSKKLLEATRLVPHSAEPEDLSICRTHRSFLEVEHDIRFADLQAARGFAYEREAATGAEFGFHGVYNLLSEISVKEATRLLGSLELGMLGARESVELMFAALKRSHFDLARIALEHVRAHPRVLERVLRGLSWSEQGRRQRASRGGS